MPDFFQNGIANVVLNFYRVYQRIIKIIEMNTRLILASRMQLQKGLLGQLFRDSCFQAKCQIEE